jgi:hypothetical protein
MKMVCWLDNYLPTIQPANHLFSQETDPACGTATMNENLLLTADG